MPAADGEAVTTQDADLAALWTAAAEASEDALFAIDARGDVLTWALGAARLFGRPADDVVGRPAGALLAHGHDGADPIERVLAGERIERLPVDIRRDDGMVVPIALTLVPLGAGRGACVLAKDLTEQRVAQATLVESELRLREAQELSHVGLWLWERRSDALQMSDELYRSHELDPFEFEATMTAYLMLVHPDERDALRAGLARAVMAERSFEREYRIVRRGGDIGWIYARASVEVDDAGEVIGLRGIAQDISERKGLETELAAARDRAMEVSRLKSDFLATMSHEIRTPMNGVIGMIGLLLDGELEPQQRAYAETARSSGEALLTIINHILDFSKIEAGRLEQEIIDFDLRSVLEEVAELLAEQAHGKGLEIALLVRPGVPTSVRGDPGRLRQVVTNLVGNAVKFTHAGEVVVRAGVAEESDEDVLVRIEVADSGVGIPAAARPAMFEPFSQGDASTTRNYGGTGLGLAISKQLVELMGGEIQVESEDGRGSVFTFTVRLIKQPPPSRPVPVPRESLVGLRALIVDDNATNRFILAEQLNSAGIASGMADGGSAALDELRAALASDRRYDVVLLDMMMPERDGIEVAQAIRGDAALTAIPIVLLTSGGIRGSAGAARAAGIDAFLAKPVRQSHLFDAIAAVLGRGGAREPLVTQHTIAEARPRAHARLLVADDNVVNQMVAVAMLTKIGYRADVVANGAEAVEAASRIGYAAILMDCQMPEMDGYEATGEIRRRESGGAHVPIIAMTAGALAGDRERCTAAGMDDYVAKPVTIDELAGALRRCVDRDPSVPDG